MGPAGLAFPLPDPLDPLTGGFWQAASEGRLAIPRCRRCGRLVWYPQPTCPACAAPEPEWATVSGRGTLYTWTVVHRALLPEYAGSLPFTVGLVALDEDPSVRLVTRLADCSDEHLRAGMDLEVCFRELRYPPADAGITAPFFRSASARSAPAPRSPRERSDQP